MEPRGAATYPADVGTVIDLEHVRRSERLFRILIDRFGLEHFLVETQDKLPRVRAAAVDDALKLVEDWMERQTGRTVERPTRRLLARSCRRNVHQKLAEHLVLSGY